LKRADLCGAHLYGADLRGADLRGADLRGANLYGANLRGADLNRADLSKTNLKRADLREADLSETCLSPTATLETPTLTEISEAGLTNDGEYVYGYRTLESQHCGNTTYTPGEHKAPYFSVDRNTPCHPGIYFATRDWLFTHDYSLVSLVIVRARINETVHAGDKWRARRIWVLNERIGKWEN
jgi:hypothetical protein